MLKAFASIHIFAFCCLITGFVYGDDQHQRAIRELSLQVDKILPEIDQEEDDQLYTELSLVVSDLYKKLVEITALYFIGNSYSSAKILHERLFFEIGKDVITIVKIFALYLPTMLSSKELSWKTKVKKCSYIVVTVTVLVLWIKEYYTSYVSKMDMLDPVGYGYYPRQLYASASDIYRPRVSDSFR